MNRTAGGIALAWFLSIAHVSAAATQQLDGSDDRLTIELGRSVVIPVLVNDGNPNDHLKIYDISSPVLGTIPIVSPAHGLMIPVDGEVTEIPYTPRAIGADWFTYSIENSPNNPQGLRRRDGIRVDITVEEFSNADIPAFPGAEGPGAITAHGRGGQVLYVTHLGDPTTSPSAFAALTYSEQREHILSTTLEALTEDEVNDRVSGYDDYYRSSFRHVVNRAGARIVCFKKGGTIELSRRVDIAHPNLYIAGQSAPGGGITLTTAGDKVGLLFIRTHDVVIRYLRFRPRVTEGRRRLAGKGQNHISARGSNIVIDHSSFSWNMDDNGPWINESNLNVGYGFPIYNQTWQRNIFAEAVQHVTAFLIGGNPDYFSDRGGAPYNLGRYVTDIAFHHNLFIHIGHRNPKGNGRGVRVVNNVVYNWGNYVGGTIADAHWDYLNNYYVPGPMTGTRYLTHEANAGDGNPLYNAEALIDGTPSIHISGNVFLDGPEQRDLGVEPDPDQWGRIEHHFSSSASPQGGVLPSAWRRDAPMPSENFPIRVEPAFDAYQGLLTDVGANRQVLADGSARLRPDAVDQRLLQDLETGTGHSSALQANSVEDLPTMIGDLPALESGEAYVDADGDCMADEWENLHDFDAGRATDAGEDADGDGYTNVEEFLNFSDPHRQSNPYEIERRRFFILWGLATVGVIVVLAFLYHLRRFGSLPPHA